MNREKILQLVCTYFDVDENLVKSDSRKQKIVEVRQIYCYLSFLFARTSYERIGKLVNRDHATVTHSVKTITNLMSVEEDLYNSIQFLKSKIKTEPEIVVSDINLLQLSKNYTESFVNHESSFVISGN